MGKIVHLPRLRDRSRVFEDRADAGNRLAEMLEPGVSGEELVLAIPAGGAPVAAAMADRLSLMLDVAVISKITPPWNTEVGYGAVAFDGSVALNDRLVAAMGLSEADIQEGIRRTRRKVERRVEKFREDRPFPDVKRTVLLVDDGLASGWTMRAALDALRQAGAARLIVCVPTGHDASVKEISELATELYCANLRGGPRFAVADAYTRWTDVSEEEALAALRHARTRGSLE